MRVFAVSDLHVDYAENLQWVMNISSQDFQQDVLILAGDVSDKLELLTQVFEDLQKKFHAVLFVPGNHELWVQNEEFDCSLVKYEAILRLCKEIGIHTELFHTSNASFVPLLSWYDFSFGEPDQALLRAWRDFRACNWPEHLDDSKKVCAHFLAKNLPLPELRDKYVISYSHFLPRIDVMPSGIPLQRRQVYPVLGSSSLGEQIKILQPNIHVYGHSHVNQVIEIDGVTYINNAFAYPREKRIARKQLHCVVDFDAEDRVA